MYPAPFVLVYVRDQCESLVKDLEELTLFSGSPEPCRTYPSLSLGLPVGDSYYKSNVACPPANKLN